jgi:7-carboxy-7-deazaguanine synthase
VFLPSGVETLANPLSVDAVDQCVRGLDAAAGPHHAISITGGEPLLFVDFLLSLLPRWAEFDVLLETGGHRPDDLAMVIDHVDIVMMDVKLQSSAGCSSALTETRRFWEIAARKEVAVKLVCNAKTTVEEIEPIAGMLAGSSTPLILQPVSGAAFQPTTGDHMIALQRAAMKLHRPTRVIPQTHRQLHVR